MPVRRLRIEAVRCLTDVDVELDPARTYLIGPNGAGKTTFLEAIHLLGRGRSFRTRQNTRLVQHGRESFSVYGEVTAEGRRHRVGVGFRDGRLEVRVDGDSAAGMAELAAHLAVFVLEPRLHSLIEAGPSERRRYIDAGVFHVEHRYLSVWRAYRRALGQRNAALKGAARRHEVEVWTESLLEAAKQIDAARRTYVDELSIEVDRVARPLIGVGLEIAYRPGWPSALSLEQALEASWESDRSSGFTQVGPHRAELRMRLDESEVKDAASRGQQKLVAAALVIGQVRVYERRGGTAATVLVDDPVAELDRAALERLVRELESLRSQLVITALDTGGLSPHPGFPVFHVEQGTVVRVV